MRRLTAAASSSASRALELDPDLVDAYVNLGRIAHEAGRGLEAIRLYELALERTPEDPVLHFNLGGVIVGGVMPGGADIVLLMGFLADFGDLGMAVHGAEEAVDIDRAPDPGEGDMLLGRQRLAAKEDDAVPVKGAADVRDLGRRQGPRQIDAVNFGADGGRQLAHLYCIEGHQKITTLRNASPRLTSAMASLISSSR